MPKTETQPDPSMVVAWVNGRWEPTDKVEAHRLGLRHKAVSVFVFDGEKTLLQCRAPTKYHSGGLWANTCCSHPMWGETPLDCATRRLQEELGIEGLELEHRGSLKYRARVSDEMIEDEEVEVFFAEWNEDAVIVENPKEVSKTHWADPSTLSRDVERWPDQFTEWFKIYVTEHPEIVLHSTGAAE